MLALQLMTGRLAQGERVAQSLCSSNSAAFYLMNIQFLLMPWRAAPKKPQSLKTRDSALPAHPWWWRKKMQPCRKLTVLLTLTVLIFLVFTKL